MSFLQTNPHPAPKSPLTTVTKVFVTFHNSLICHFETSAFVRLKSAIFWEDIIKSNKGTRQSRCLSLSRPISYCISSHFAIYRGETLGLAKVYIDIVSFFSWR